MSSKLIFKDINVIFFKENFNIIKRRNYYRFHFGTFLLGANEAKDPQTTKIIFFNVKLFHINELGNHYRIYYNLRWGWEIGWLVTISCAKFIL